MVPCACCPSGRTRSEREALDLTAYGSSVCPGNLIVRWRHRRFHDNLFPPGLRFHDLSFSRRAQVRPFTFQTGISLIRILSFQLENFPLLDPRISILYRQLF